jgi:hypothetical protein
MDVWVDPGWVPRALVLSAFPAFLLGGLIVSTLGHVGVSEVITFMVSTPVLIIARYYVVGWLVARSGNRVKTRATSA